MGQTLQFALTEIRPGKRKDYPDYFVSIRQFEGCIATVSRQRNQSIVIHFHDQGALTFDNQQVDSFDFLKPKDLGRLDLLKIPIFTQECSGEIPETFQAILNQEIMLFSQLISGLGIEVETNELDPSYQWFANLLNSEKDQAFLRDHMASVRYFHGDFDPLKVFLREDMAQEENGAFDDPEEDDSFSFEGGEDINFDDC